MNSDGASATSSSTCAPSRRTRPALAIDPRPGAGERVERAVAQALHADLLEDPERGPVDRLDLVGADDLERPERVAERPPGSGARRRRPRRTRRRPCSGVNLHLARRATVTAAGRCAPARGAERTRPPVRLGRLVPRSGRPPPRLSCASCSAWPSPCSRPRPGSMPTRPRCHWPFRPAGCPTPRSGSSSGRRRSSRIAAPPSSAGRFSTGSAGSGCSTSGRSPTPSRR